MLDKCRLSMMDFYSSRCDCSCPIAFVHLNRIISVIEWQHHVHNDITTGGPLDLISVELDVRKDSPKTNVPHFFLLFIIIDNQSINYSIFKFQISIRSWHVSITLAETSDAILLFFIHTQHTVS